MSSDLFGNLGGLGGLVKGLSGLMPQDDPNVKIMNAQSELADLKKQEMEIYAEIGKKAVSSEGSERFGELGDKLRLVQSNLAAAENNLSAVKEEKEKVDQATAQNACPSCGHVNPEGTKFCQECGAKLGAAKLFCGSCGTENPAGTRFCGSCGARIGDS